MNTLELRLLDIKNPYKAFEFSMINNIWKIHIQDSNSFVWKNYIEKYYPQYEEHKIKNLSFMDYYVLLYNLDELYIINNTNILNYTQLSLATLPRIYEGDHLKIINYVYNLSFLSGYANIILYRKEVEPNKGELKCIYSEHEENKVSYFKNEPSILNIKNNYSNPINGEIFKLYSSE